MHAFDTHNRRIWFCCCCCLLCRVNGNISISRVHTKNLNCVQCSVRRHSRDTILNTFLEIYILRAQCGVSKTNVNNATLTIFFIMQSVKLRLRILSLITFKCVSWMIIKRLQILYLNSIIAQSWYVCVYPHNLSSLSHSLTLHAMKWKFLLN